MIIDKALFDVVVWFYYMCECSVKSLDIKRTDV